MSFRHPSPSKAAGGFQQRLAILLSPFRGKFRQFESLPSGFLATVYTKLTKPIKQIYN